MEENAKLEIPGWSSLLLLAYLRQELWERGYDSLSAEGSQTPAIGSHGLCQICPVLIDRLPVLPTPLTATPFIPSLQLTELSLSIWFTGAKTRDYVGLLGVPACLCGKPHPWPWGTFFPLIPTSFPSSPRSARSWGFYMCHWELVETYPPWCSHGLLAPSCPPLQEESGESLTLPHAVGHGHLLIPSIKGVRFGS